MTTILLVLAVAASAQGSLGLVRPAKEMTPKKRLPLVCTQADSIRDFKAAVVEDSGWEHKLADEWARCACPAQADKAGWPKPMPELPLKWRGALPILKPGQHEANVKRLAEDFLLFHMRPLPIDAEQAVRIADCWAKENVGVHKSRQQVKKVPAKP